MTLAAVVLSEALARGRESDGQGHDGEEVSSATYERFRIYLGEGKAVEVADDVRSGKMSAAEAEEWADGLEAAAESSRGHRDIEWWEWRDFEEGWRPDGR